MSNAVFSQGKLKQARLVPKGSKAVGKLSAVVGLNALHGEGKAFEHVVNKARGGICAEFIESLDIPQAWELVDGGILIELFARRFSEKADCGHVLDVDLNALSRTDHLLVRFGDILGICGFYAHLSVFAKCSVKSRYAAGVAALHQFDPQYYQTLAGISFQ